MSRRFGAALCLTLAVLPSGYAEPQAAGDSPWRVSGYVLSLYTRSRTVVPPAEPFALDLNRVRLKLEGTPIGGLGLEVQYDNELLIGSYVKTGQFALTEDRTEAMLDLQRDYVTRGEVVARHGLYRAIVTWSGTSTDVKVGRQRVALGTGYFWSPMDLLNLIDPTRLERDYRSGADAVLVEQKLGAVSRAAAIFAPSNGRSRSVAAGYFHGNVRGTDFSALIGTFRGDDVLGADFATARGGLGIRGEATLTRAGDGARFARGLLGADYGFASSATVTVEAYYNGRGTTDPARYDFESVLAGRALNVGRLYSAAAVAYPITPLLKIGGYAVVNVNDGSGVFWPRLEWSAMTNMDLVAGVQRFAGRAETEYGRLSNLLHGEVRWFF
jgi:hypothetical protein